MTTRLRLFTGDAESQSPAPTDATAVLDTGVQVRLGDVLPVLRAALLARREWLDDFADEDVTVPAELYDYLAPYMHLRPSA